MPTVNSIETRTPPIDEIVGLLDKHAPGILQEIREKYPEQADLLEAGLIAGTETTQQLQVRIETCLLGLKTAMHVCEKLLPKSKQKLKRASKLRFSSELVTAISGASIFTVLAVEAPKTARYAVAALALVGTLLALTTQYIGGALHPSAGNLFDQYKELIDCHVEAKQIHNELELWNKTGIEGFSEVELITKGNAICRRIALAESMT